MKHAPTGMLRPPLNIWASSRLLAVGATPARVGLSRLFKDRERDQRKGKGSSHSQSKAQSLGQSVWLVSHDGSLARDDRD